VRANTNNINRCLPGFGYFVVARPVAFRYRASMKIARTGAALILLFFFSPRIAEAQVIPGRWGKVEALPPGSDIIVILLTGARWEYALKSASTDFLILTAQEGRELRVAKADIRTVSRIRRDPLRNGVLIGAGIGFGAGFFGLAIANAKATASGPIWDREDVGYYTAAGLGGAGIGALVGLAIDWAVRRPEVLYSSR
jgi:hypothetical protein